MEDSERIVLLPDLDDAKFAAELERQKQAWVLLDKGWKLYEPLPQTKEEAREWKAFVPAAKAWKTRYDGLIAQIAKSRETAGQGPAGKGRGRKSGAIETIPAEVETLLSSITSINYQVAVALAKQQTVDSYQAMTRAQDTACSLLP